MIKNIIRNEYHLFYKRFSLTLIALYSFLIIFVSIYMETNMSGEYDDYMLGTIALQNHFTLEITAEDVERGMADFPAFAEGFQASYNDGQVAGLFQQPSGGGGKIYPFYFGTYSFVCIPVKVLFQLIGFEQAKAFAVTNALLLSGTLFIAFFCLRMSHRQKAVTLLLLMGSPVFPYFFWQSAEVLIHSFVVLSMVFLHNRQFRKAAVFISFAGTLNVTVMAFGFAMILIYLFEKFKELRESGVPLSKDTVIKELKNLILFGLSFSPALIVFVRNGVVYGAIAPQLAIGQGENGQLFARFLSYLFDLNLGFLPFMPIALALFFIGAALAVFRKNITAVLYAAGFFLAILAYAGTVHINSGMTGIARYNAWLAPVLIFFIASVTPKLTMSQAGNTRLLFSAVFSSALTLLITLSLMTANYRDFTPVAKFAFDHAPALYNPVPQVFMTRLTHNETAILSPEEVADGNFFAYSGPDGFIRKILLHKGGAAAFIEGIESGEIIGPPESIQKLRDMAAQKEDALKTRYQYLSVPASLKLEDASGNVYSSLTKH